MRTIIAGTRYISNYQLVIEAVRESGFIITEVVSGHAHGVDQLGERYALEHDLPLKIFPAEWNEYGKSAGFRRNRQMAEYAEALIAIWQGKSRGTRNMIQEARYHDLKIYMKEI